MRGCLEAYQTPCFGHIQHVAQNAGLWRAQDHFRVNTCRGARKLLHDEGVRA